MSHGGQLTVRTATMAHGGDLFNRHGDRRGRPTASKMFEAFFSTKRRLGLGLPTTQKIIGGHGGRIGWKASWGAARSSLWSCDSGARLGRQCLTEVNVESLR